MDRAAAKLDVIQGNPFLDSYSALLVINYGRSTPARKRPWLDVTSKYKPIVEVEMGNLLEGTADPEFDAIKIATIYFLSPPGYSPNMPMDDTWTPFVKHMTSSGTCATRHSGLRRTPKFGPGVKL